MRFCFLISCLLLCVPVQAQTFGSAVFDFLQLNPDPRARALGEATVALRGYAGASSVNPATIGQRGLLQLATNLRFAEGLAFQSDWVTNSRFAPDQQIRFVSADLGGRRWSIAYHYHQHLIAEYEGRDQNNNRVDVKELERRHKLAASLQLATRWRIGAAISHLKRTVFTQDIGTVPVAVDAGVHYEHPLAWKWGTGQVAGGLSLTQWGPLVGFGETTQRAPQATRLQAGLAFQVEGSRQFRDRALWSGGVFAAASKPLVAYEEETVIDVAGRDSFTVLWPAGPLKALYESWKPFRICPGAINDCQEDPSRYESYNAFEQLSWHLGIEVGVLEVLYLRYGWKRVPSYYERNRYGTLGVGIDLHYLALDFSHMLADGPVFSAQQTFWRLTGRIPLDLFSRW